MAASYLKAQIDRSHDICVYQTRGVNEVVGGPSIYVVSFPRVFQEVKCPVPGCPEVAHCARRLRKHFMYRHLISKVAVVQEWKEPLPRCDLCGMHIPAGRIIRHMEMAR